MILCAFRETKGFFKKTAQHGLLQSEGMLCSAGARMVAVADIVPHLRVRDFGAGA